MLEREMKLDTALQIISDALHGWGYDCQGKEFQHFVEGVLCMAGYGEE